MTKTRKDSNHEYYVKNKEKWKDYNAHRDPVKRRESRIRNKDKENSRRREKYNSNEIFSIAKKINDRSRRMEWYEILRQRGLLQCSKCGYHKNYAALDYHHLDPSKKTITIGALIYRSPKVAKNLEELSKVVCLCKNCHTEKHFPQLEEENL